MPNTKYRCAEPYRADMAMYMRHVQQENGDERERGQLIQNLLRCIREDVSPRQRTLLLLYYEKGMSQPQIAAELGVNKSTVCRTIKRGERRLQQCLRYGAQRYLMSLQE